MTTTDFKIVIPARYGSSRFPGKPLVEIAGLPMIAHTWRCAKATSASEIVVATDDARIRDYCHGADIEVIMTSEDHPTGTDRVAEVVEIKAWNETDIVVCLQGDEPTTPAAIVHQVARNLSEHGSASIATLCARLQSREDYLNPNRVKVVFDQQGYAMYFSRAPIPHRRDQEKETTFPTAWVHIGMYAYRVKFLREYKTLAPHDYEVEEKLEQLRALGNGYRIHVDVAEAMPGHGVDHPDDVAIVEKLLEKTDS